MLNATPLLKLFLDDIDLTGAQRRKLDKAKQTVRKTLRQAFKNARQEIRTQSGKAVSLTPRFRTQGSFVLKTINQPAYPPKQQIDVDDGTYLPMSFMDDLRPTVVSEIFFSFVDGVLKRLAKEKNWEFVGNKDTCVRLVIDDESHIDVPLYAIPEDQYELLEARMAKARMQGIAAFSSIDESYGFAIDPDQVQLAHRKEGWKSSDPRKVQKWFLTEVKIHGNQLRRLCRLLKAWRDHHPELDGLTSILLMAAVTEVFNDGREGLSKRDDLAFLTLTQELPSILVNDIPNPAEPSEILSDRVPLPVREKAARKLWSLEQDLKSVLNSFNGETAVTILRDHFGPRMPYRPDLIKSERARDEVSRHPAVTVAAPMVASSKSG